MFVYFVSKTFSKVLFYYRWFVRNIYWKINKKRIFYTSNVTFITTRIFRSSFFRVKSKSWYILNLQSSRKHWLIKFWNFEIRWIFINTSSRKLFASDFHFLLKSRQRNREFCYIKSSLSFVIYFSHFRHDYSLHVFFVQISHSIKIANFASKSSKHSSKLINQKSCIIKNAKNTNSKNFNQCIMRKRFAHLSNNMLIDFRKFQQKFSSKNSFIHVVVVFKFFVLIMNFTNIFESFIWIFVTIVKINFEESFKRNPQKCLIKKREIKLFSYFLLVLLIDFSRFDFTFFANNIDCEDVIFSVFCEQLLWILHVTHVLRILDIEFYK